jgi:EamA domain-containing membrane protein RarD
MTPATRSGALYAVGAFTIWGLHPLYFLQVVGVPPLELLMHRALWAALSWWCCSRSSPRARGACRWR